jgi:DNA repair protein RadD
MNITDTHHRQPVPPTLRPYQLAVIGRADAEIAAGRRSIIIVAPTGAGKTVIAAKIANDAEARGKRVLFLVHRRELVIQSSAKLHATGLDHGIVAAGFPTRPGEPIQVASIQTLHARSIRSSAMKLPDADLILVDEAHHATAQTWKRILQAYPAAIVIGLSATPCRGDGRGLGGIFKSMVECPSVPELIAGGFLVPTKVYAPSSPDLTGVRIRHGDYNETQLAERMDRAQLVGDVVTHWHRLAAGRRTVVFATSVAHAVHLRDQFGRSGVAAAHVDGSTPAAERDGILGRLATGTLEVVVNCGVLTEGFDLPAIGCLVLARPTKSLVLYRQILGRGLRPSPGKDHVLVLDHAGATFEHGLIEEPIEWTLAPDKRAERPPHASRGKQQAPELKNCPECSAVRWNWQPCAECGWRPRTRPEAIETLEGELGHLGDDYKAREQKPTADEKLKFFQELLWIAREKGYQPGWAAHKYREKFSVWPQRQSLASPVEPRPEVRSWVRSKQIAWAKSKGARAAAGAA